MARRQSFTAAASAAELLVVEDDPYGALAYSGQTLPSLLSMRPESTVYLGSFSKVLAPGLRVGYAIAPPELHLKLVQAKQAADLHTPSFNQRIIYELVKDGFLDVQIPKIRALYESHCRTMLQAMDEHFPTQAQWTRPRGGMFIWVSLPPHCDTTELLQQAIARNVAFVPGAPFFATDVRKNRAARENSPGHRGLGRTDPRRCGAAAGDRGLSDSGDASRSQP
jgi:2-aminoadipate transaminase